MVRNDFGAAVFRERHSLSDPGASSAMADANQSGGASGKRPKHATSTRSLREQRQRDFELTFFEGLLERDPLHTGALAAHAENLAAIGDATGALQIDRRLVRLLPERPVAWYNLACSYAVLGLLEPAFFALQRSLELGYHHLDHLARDPDLRPLRRDARFFRMLQKLKLIGR